MGIVAGDKVRHALHGEGFVVSIQGSGDNAKVTVDFPGLGEQRTMLIVYSMLEKLV
jgi:hypothetical protein